MLKNTSNSYGSVSKFFHWVMAVMLICLLSTGFWMKALGIPMKMHKAMGFMVLLLVIARLLWRFGNKVPEYDASMPRWQALAGHFFHYGLYALMLVMPLSAFIASNAAQYPVSFLFLFDMPSIFVNKDIELAKISMGVHKFIAWVFVWAISVHGLAALYHHLIRKDNILARMLPFNIMKD